MKTGKGEMTVCRNCASRKVGKKLFLGIMQAGRGGTFLPRNSAK
jgi:hypothetical protein